MPIPFLYLPGKEFQCTLDCIDVGDLIALSLCSKRTKNIVKSLNRRIDSHFAKIDENCIRYRICTRKIEDLDPDNWELPDFISFEFFDSRMNIDRDYGLEVWKDPNFTRGHWIAHFLNIFNEESVESLVIEPVNESHLDTVKQSIPKCHRLFISDNCSPEFTKIAFFKLFSMAEGVEFRKNVFETDFVQFLTLNLKNVGFFDVRNPFKLTSNDLMVLNIIEMDIKPAIITDKELNRFLKLWLKGNHGFYRPKLIRLIRNDRRGQNREEANVQNSLVNREEVFKGFKYEDDANKDNLYLLKRADGKELKILITDNDIEFEFE